MRFCRAHWSLIFVDSEIVEMIIVNSQERAGWIGRVLRRGGVN